MNSSNRTEQLRQWLKHCFASPFELDTLPHDASFRRYHRIVFKDQTFIAMDAPPELEPVEPFCTVQRILKNKGLIVPDIFHASIEQGFLVLTDFGDITFLKHLCPMNADELYTQAFNALLVLHKPDEHAMNLLPRFTELEMWAEWNGFCDWFVEGLLHLPNCKAQPELVQSFSILVENAVHQPQTIMHRDYHSANLMLLHGQNQPGILDFQNAFIGPITYDLVSLLRDCYIDWPETKTLAWLNDYRMRLNDLGHAYSQAEFTHWFDLMGVERHLKALFTFARKALRDQQPQYLNHVPRVLRYLDQTLGYYPELRALHLFVENLIPAFMEFHACAP